MRRAALPCHAHVHLRHRPLGERPLPAHGGAGGPRPLQRRPLHQRPGAAHPRPDGALLPPGPHGPGRRRARRHQLRLLPLPPPGPLLRRPCHRVCPVQGGPSVGGVCAGTHRRRGGAELGSADHVVTERARRQGVRAAPARHAHRPALAPRGRGSLRGRLQGLEAVGAGGRATPRAHRRPVQTAASPLPLHHDGRLPHHRLGVRVQAQGPGGGRSRSQGGPPPALCFQGGRLRRGCLGKGQGGHVDGDQGGHRRRGRGRARSYSGSWRCHRERHRVWNGRRGHGHGCRRGGRRWPC
mmetsp:Transcript_1167/g.4507  ORF Transcript_1167/g.4507 Transcript_1167/m.4507 type:complete len:296 (-) Transcript_1167:208-1095(-)